MVTALQELPTGPLGATASIKLASGATPVIPGFELREPLGRGGMGVVFRAREVAAGREVAIKWLASNASEVMRRRFEREALAAGAVKHRNIVPILSAGSTRQGSFIVMELVEGFSLAAALDGHALGPNALVDVVSKVARALAAAHGAGVVHRDVKPENVLVDLTGEPRLLDFGLARFLHTEGQLTAKNAALGTLGYMAPEVFAGGGSEAGPACDVFALGAILYEGLAGEPPFGRGDSRAIAVRLNGNAVPPLPESTPAPLAALCARALDRDPKKRPSASEIADGLEAFLRPAPKPALPSKTARLAVACALGAAIGVLVVGIALREPKAPGPDADTGSLAAPGSPGGAPSPATLDSPPAALESVSDVDSDADLLASTGEVSSDSILPALPPPAPPPAPAAEAQQAPAPAEAPVAAVPVEPAPPAPVPSPKVEAKPAPLTRAELDAVRDKIIAALGIHDRAHADLLAQGALDRAPKGEDERLSALHTVLGRDAVIDMKTALAEREYLEALILDPENVQALLGSYANALLEGTPEVARKRFASLEKLNAQPQLMAARALSAVVRRERFLGPKVVAGLVQHNVDVELVRTVARELRAREPEKRK